MARARDAGDGPGGATAENPCEDPRTTTGLPDDAFDRGAVPMTKREVRAVTLAYARLSRDSRVLDVGAGTGGLTIEAARFCGDGEVVAVERAEEALELLTANAYRLAPHNVRVVAGEAPVALETLEPGSFDAALVGGHGGRLADILAAVARVLVPGGRVVVNVVGLGAAQEALGLLGKGTWADRECAQVSISRAEPLGPDVRLVPLNPVFVLSARLAEEA